LQGGEVLYIESTMTHCAELLLNYPRPKCATRHQLKVMDETTRSDAPQQMGKTHCDFRANWVQDGVTVVYGDNGNTGQHWAHS